MNYSSEFLLPFILEICVATKNFLLLENKYIYVKLKMIKYDGNNAFSFDDFYFKWFKLYDYLAIDYISKELSVII